MATAPAEYGTDDKGIARSLGRYWHDQLDQSEKLFKQRFWERGEKIVRRYRDERDAVENRKRRFNILWSNVQVMKPALYGRPAKPDVQRRHNDSDPVGRAASLMIERTLLYEVENYTDFDAAMTGAVEDRLLPGRGVSWLRYEPNIVRVAEDEETQETEAQETGTQITEDVEAPPNERVASARSPTDYVYWQDFLHNPARTWEEVWWVSRWVYMTKKEGLARFGEIFEAVPIAYDATENATSKKPKLDTADKKAKVAEIWNKRTGKVCWVAKGYPNHLDEKADPLQLEGFFPCPRPLNATTTTDNVLPVADYVQYQDQAEELDTLTQRISMLTKACKAVGVFNAEHKALLRLFNEGVDNTMIPVDSWAAFAEKGGLKGEVVFLDLTTIIATLAQLYESREQVKQTIYEVMGISDVLRGATNPNETLGAQQLKANFGSSRMKADQQQVARYASDLFKMKAQIVCKFYPPELIVEMSGIEQTPDGKDPQVVAQALELLKNSTSRDWRISVEADSLAQMDEQAEKAERMEFVAMIGNALKEAGPVVGAAPELGPMVFEAIKFAARGFKIGKTFEAIIEQAEQAFRQKPPPQPPVDNSHLVEEQKTQQAQIKEQADVQRHAQEQQANVAAKQQEDQADLQRQQTAIQEKALLDANAKAAEVEKHRIETTSKYDFERWKVQEDNKTKIDVAKIQANAKADAAEEAELGGSSEPGERRKKPIERMEKMHGDTLGVIKGLAEVLALPQVPVRGADGRVTRIERVRQ